MSGRRPQPTLFDMPQRVRPISPHEMVVQIHLDGTHCTFAYYFLPGHVTHDVARASVGAYLDRYARPQGVGELVHRDLSLCEALIVYGYVEDIDADEDDPRSWFKAEQPGESWTRVELGA